LQCVAGEGKELPVEGVLFCAAAPTTLAPTKVADSRRVFNIGVLLGKDAAPM
jgi:hypothetical protein